MSHPKHHNKKPRQKPKPRQKQKFKESRIWPFFELYFLPVMLILLMPFVYSYKTMDVNSAPRMLAFGGVVVVFAVFNLLKRKKNNCSYQFLSLTFFAVAVIYIAWTIITLFFAVNPGEGTFDVAKSLVTLGLLIYFVQLFIVHKNAFEIVVKSVIISAVIATAVGLFQYITKVQGKSDYELYMALYAVKGLMSHKNQFAISLLLMLPFVIYGLFTLNKLWKGVAGYAILMILINITIIQTRSVWIATIFFLLSLGLLSVVFLLNNNLRSFMVKNKKVLLISVSALIVILVVAVVIIKSSGTSSLMKEQVSSTFSTKSANAQWRIKMWNASLQLAKDNPWVGVGAGNWKIAIIPYYHLNFGSEYQNWGRPHNDFLWVLTEKGILGLLLFLALFGLIFYYGFKMLFSETDKDKSLKIILMMAGITGYMFVSLFTFPLERVNHQIYLVVMMSVIIAAYYKPKAVETGNKWFVKVNLLILVASLFSAYYGYLYVRSEVYAKKLRFAMNAGRQQKVIRYADMAFSPFTTIDYNNVPLKMYRGVANMRLNRFQEGYADLKEALKCFPNQVAVLNNLAISASELHKNKESVEYFNQALFLFPHYEESLSNMVIAFYRSKEYEKAYVALLNQDTRKPNKQYKDFKSTLERRINSRPLKRKQQ